MTMEVYRSWLFAPGTEKRKMEKALAATAARPFYSAYLGAGFLAQPAVASRQQPLVERFLIEPEASLYGKMIDPTDGYYRVGDGLGLGCEPDEELIKDYRVTL